MLVPETEVIVQIDGAEAQRLVLPPGEYVIGRIAECELRVEADLVSRKHARLIINYDHALIEDLGSSNGTFVNGAPVTDSTRLWPGQKIQVGAATITLHRQRAPLDPDVSLTPQVAVVRRLLPEEVLRAQKYDIGGQIAQGGMGAILTAREAAIRREIAMKVMLGSGDEADLMRFVEEAQITGQLEHPNIVPIHELGVDENDQLFYTMKMVRGITLKKVLDLLAAGTPETIAKYPLATLLTIFQKVCDAVAFAHSKGVIHRDLKPENLMLGGYGEVLVMDWGLAKVIAPGGPRAVDAPDPSGTPARSVVLSVRHEQGVSGSTLDGTIMGTPKYMAPEQARGEVETLDARTDIYALGAILFHLLALHPSVAGTDAMEIVEKVARGEVEPLSGRVGVPPAGAGVSPERTSEPHGDVHRGSGRSFGQDAQTGGRDAHPTRDIPDSLAAVIRKAMALRPEERYTTVPELQAEIAAYQAGFATSAENASLFKQAALLVRRHKGVFTTAAAAWAVITALAVWFVVNVTRERNRAEREKVRAEAGEQRAEHSLAAANAHLLRVKVEKARDAFDSGRADEGLAWLAAVLRQDPQNRFAPAWLRSALTDRNFPLPSAPPISVEKTDSGYAGETIASVQFSADGRKLLIASPHGGVTLWDAATSRQLGQPLSHLHARDAVFMPDGRRVVWLGGSGKAGYGDIEKGEKLAITPDTLPPIVRMALSPDGRLLAVADAQRDHSWGSDRNDHAKHARVAWRGTNGDTTMRVFHRPYENPRPDAEIAWLDFVSAETEAAPFAVAITVE